MDTVEIFVCLVMSFRTLTGLLASCSMSHFNSFVRKVMATSRLSETSLINKLD